MNITTTESTTFKRRRQKKKNYDLQYKHVLKDNEQDFNNIFLKHPTFFRTKQKPTACRRSDLNEHTIYYQARQDQQMDLLEVTDISVIETSD